MTRGVLDALPFALVIGVLGVVFAAGAGPLGIGPGEAVLMSVVVFSGSAQFAALAMWTQGGLPVLLATALLNTRFVLLASTMAARLPRLPLWQRALMGAGVSDEAFGLFVARGPGATVAYLGGAMVTLYLPWQVGTLVGVAPGTAIPPVWQEWLSSVFPLMFVVLTVLSANTGRKALVAVAAAGLTVVGSRFLPGAWSMLGAGVAGGALGLLLDSGGEAA